MSSRSKKNQQFRFLPEIIIALLIALTGYSTSKAQDLDVPYVPTPEPVVDKMLEMGHVEKGDYVIDLGSGDGRIVIAAAKRGATGHGIDLDPQRIREARENARRQEVDDRVVFLQQNIFDTDISQASVVTMYLLPSVNIKLRSTLLKTLRPGTRIVSHSFDMDEWEPDATTTVNRGVGRNHSIYMWIIPANVQGKWQWKVGENTYAMNIDQHFQKINIDLSNSGHTLSTNKKVLNGPRISFTTDNNGMHYVFSGQIDGDTIQGTVQIHNGGDDRVEKWIAKKK